MRLPTTSVRLSAWLAVLILLQGCAAATVIRKQPDFNDENNSRLQQMFPAGKVVAASTGETAQYGW